MEDQPRFQRSLGGALRRARLARGLRLRDVEIGLAGALGPSAIGGYERGERAISAWRLVELARFYGVAPENLLAEALSSLAPGTRRKVVIDLNRLSVIDQKQRRVLAAFAHDVQAKRGDYLTPVISLRGGDVEELAAQAGTTSEELLKRLERVLR